MDNGLVFCVTTIHRVGTIAKSIRRRPRITQNNKGHVQEVWGDDGKKAIYIPRLINDYNHWMGGVDIADQRISYYQSDLRCRRNWIPMFIQLLAIIRSNSYIVHRSVKKDKALSHKKFTLEMIESLMNTAQHHYINPRSTPKSSPESSTEKKRSLPPLTPRQFARTKKNSTMESLLVKYPHRKYLPRVAHQRIQSEGKKSGSCVWCAQLYCIKRTEGVEVNWQKMVKRTTMVCGYCCSFENENKVCFLCEDHFDVFHDTK